jgi:hypothetical protein
MKILFLLKKRGYGDYGYSTNGSSYGLINSSLQLIYFLEKEGFECKVETVNDGNDIDKEVYNYKPNIVIIEALWVSAEKMKELIELTRYKNIKWIIRIHSDIGFLSSETFATKYINDYISLHKKNLIIGINNKNFMENYGHVLNYKFVYLPNVIKTNEKNIEYENIKNEYINIGCFGALRILKNQCFQAICAIKAADILNKKLKFYITLDTKNSIYFNLKEIFKNSKHELIVYDWQTHDEFQKLIQKMDLGLQLSFTESFNIVAADFVNNNKLILVGDSITWMPNILKTSTINYNHVINKIVFIYIFRNLKILKLYAKYKLNKYNNKAKKEWLKFLSK